MRTITIGPAFGRDYSSKARALADWDANKDFIIHDLFTGGYVNKAQVKDLLQNGINKVMLRYNKMHMVVLIKLN